MAKTISRNARNAEKRQETESPKTVKVIDLSVPALSINDAGGDEKLWDEILAKQSITEHVKYERENFFWLQLPGLFLQKMPLEWEISMKYKDETVKVVGTHKEIPWFVNTSDNAEEGNLNKVLETFVDSLDYLSRIIQPREAV